MYCSEQIDDQNILYSTYYYYYTRLGEIHLYVNTHGNNYED